MEALFSYKPIGVMHTNKRVKFATPHQPKDGIEEHNIVELFPGRRLEDGLKDLAGFERIWLLWWFHRNPNWRPLVTPPRGPAKRRGVFATRSPHRPCPIGMTAVPLISIQGNSLIVGNCDLLEGTPILDVKPYISSVDSFPAQRQGWLGEVEEDLLKPAQYTVRLTGIAQSQADWLRDNWQIDFIERVIEILQRSPQRSRTHRITSPKDGIFRLSSGSWRVFFSVTDFVVTIVRIAPGYPKRLLMKVGYEVVPDWKAQVEFGACWGEE